MADEPTAAGAPLSCVAAIELARAALLGAGARDEVAGLVAEHVVDAELAGHPSHGLRQVPVYCAAAGEPGTDLTATPHVVSATAALTSIDAGQGLGHPALALAVDAAAAGARANGIAAAAVVRCGHAGRAGAWAERAVAQRCVGIVLLGGATPPFAMTAAPGAEPALHTNPIAIGMPAAGEPLLLDMATSLVAGGKAAVALERGGELPEGSIATHDGRRSRDPRELARGGSLLPAAGHKGYGLSALIEALSVGLTGADGPGLEPPEGALVICLDAGAFRPAGQVAGSLEGLRQRVRASSRGTVSVLAPGDTELRSRAAAGGVVRTDPALLAELRALARRPRPGKEARR
jgi:LDH2 family malate/lactate/ureidoglycolate dehydrogenase